MEKENNYFKELMKLEADVSKKANLNYISWSDAWTLVKEQYHNSNYKVATHPETGMPYFHDKTGGFVKVTVTINNVAHDCFLPIMNQPKGSMMKAIPEGEIDAFAINKSIQRALTKAIAMHGIGLYVYKGEDLPEGSTETVKKARTEGKIPGVPEEKKDEKGDTFNCTNADCGVECAEVVADYASKHFGKVLCRKCQDKERASE